MFNRFIFLLTVFFLNLFFSSAQIPDPALAGYWHNWDDANAPYLSLDTIDSRYNIVTVAFAVPQNGTHYQMGFVPDQENSASIISKIQTLQGQGKKVLISVGGAATTVSLNSIPERDTFNSTMNAILDTYGFDGMDIDLEGSSVSVTGGTIASPIDGSIINLIDAIRQIMSDYRTTHNRRLILTMAPETAFVQGGMSAFGGIWGAYLPIIEALRDSIEILHVQLYNSGSCFGIDGNIYFQGTADFIVAMTEAVIQGFNTSGGLFSGLPAHHVAVGLPACTDAAGGGFTDTLIVKNAVNYLRGEGPQPGTYILAEPNGYPDLRGMMTWSINWDASVNCNSMYEYAENYQRIFGTNATGTQSPIETEKKLQVIPNPAREFLRICVSDINSGQLKIVDAFGQLIATIDDVNNCKTINVSGLASGIYFIIRGSSNAKFIKQ